MIRIITEPTVRLVGRQSIDEAALAAFLADEGAEGWESDTEVEGQVLAEVAGRLCYQSYAKPRPGGNRAYLGHILEEGHGSVLEHCVLSFVVTGVSRSLTHELIRHRAGMGYSQRSQRYCDETEAAFVVPPALCEVAGIWRENRGTPDQYRDLYPQGACRIFQGWLADVGAAQDAYARWARFFEEDERFGFASVADRTIRRKKAREAARSVLPNCTATEIFVTGNLRALRGVCEQRAVPGADAEIRRFGVALARVLMAEVPNAVPDYRIEKDRDGEYLHHDFRKV